MSTLYMVGTPIGNLEDITLRAKRILEEVDVIACEDTRTSSKLLNALEIKKRLIACHSHNEKTSSNGIINLLEQGNDVAYISDAGTPGISDPGSYLAFAVREAGFDVVPIPGPCAYIASLSACGYVGSTITFEGFLSPKGQKRKTRIQQLLDIGSAFVLYESPYRIEKLFKELTELECDRIVICSKELTKMHELILRGTASEVYQELVERKALKGEFVITICAKGIEK